MFKDLTGQTFNRLTVVRRIESKGKNALFLCRCNCGNEKDVIVTGNALKSGNTKSCGCLKRELASKRLVKNLIGQKFGKLLVISDDGVRQDNHVKWLCDCDCGKQTEVIGKHLRSGAIKSCGCLVVENNKKMIGEKHPNWNFEKTEDLRLRDRSYKEYLDWRCLVYERDNYTCRLCKISNKSLNAHHLENYSSNKKLRTTLSNGITLCKECHNKFHRLYGTRNNTVEQYVEWIQCTA